MPAWVDGSEKDCAPAGAALATAAANKVQWIIRIQAPNTALGTLERDNRQHKQSIKLGQATRNTRG